jgi:hypothetical protein
MANSILAILLELFNNGISYKKSHFLEVPMVYRLSELAFGSVSYGPKESASY